MRIIYLPLLLFFSCNNKHANEVPANAPAKPAEKVIINYDSCKMAIATLKKQYKTGWQKLTVKEKGKYFTDAVVKTIIPAWIGTAWDFNGTTEKPQHGSIACGYFVTTILRDAGLPVARIKLAQAASETLIRAVVQPRFIKRFSNVTMPAFIQAIHDNGDGLYIIGLDNHTGFIFKEGSEISFIHSTFVGTRNVQKEPAAKSMVLNSSRLKEIGKISADEKTLDKWIHNQ